MTINKEEAIIHNKIMEHLRKHFKECNILTKDNFLGIIIEVAKERKKE